MLRAVAMIWAMLDREPLWPTRSMPHSGFTPTGADEELAEMPVRTEELCDCSWRYERWVVRAVEKERLWFGRT